MPKPGGDENKLENKRKKDTVECFHAADILKVDNFGKINTKILFQYT